LALAVADRVLMLENAIYSVISPEACASIMWKDANRKQQAAAALRYGAGDVQALGCVDEVLGEPEGGSHNDPAATFASVGERLRFHLDDLRGLSLNQLLDQRYRKFRNIAQFYTSESAEADAVASTSA
jgi:acetyl-CoA carboxylase carboxyl transferase subunit alpha